MKPADFSRIKRNSIHQRENLVKIRDFARVPAAGTGFIEFMNSLPTVGHRTNAASNLATIVDRIVKARDLSRPVIWALGPHVVKYGLTPLIVELMDLGVVQHILTNGAGAVHDTEIALIGETSEEMGGHISKGDFGMAQETGAFINGAAEMAAGERIGFGESIGREILNRELPFRDYSLFAQSVKRGIPITVHVAIGTDIIHMHPDMDGKMTGEATFFDFRRFVTTLRSLGGGGVHMNVGSTVILPEIFVKAMTAVNNLNGYPCNDYTTANFDHLSEYRPLMNVVRRGSMDGGDGYEIIGRMEIMIPLLCRILAARLRNEPA